MNLDDFSYEENGRRYINPQVALDEENAFIQNLRDTQKQDNAKIYRDTHNLGTDVTSNLGGLNGSEAYFNARYQTPQTNSSIANLRSAAQAKAFADALNNEVSKAKKRYQDAYYAAQKSGSGGGSNGSGDDDKKDEPNFETPAETDPNAVDTVTVHNEQQEINERNQKTEEVNQRYGITGSGELPNMPTTEAYYLVGPNGEKSWFAANRGIDGRVSGIDTPDFSFDRNGGKNYIDNLLRNGWRIQNRAGKTIDNGLWAWLILEKH